MRNQLNHNRTLQTRRSSTLNNSHRSHSKSPVRGPLGNINTSLTSGPHTILNPNKLQVFIKFKPPISRKTVSNSKQNRNIYDQLIDYQLTDQPLFDDGIYSNPIRYLNEKELKVDSQLYSDKIYAFDHIYHHSKTNRQVFDRTCKGLIDQIMEKGGNGLIFVYGNTGTGKTYTMGMLNLITQKSQGIVPDTLRYLFEKKGVRNSDANCSINKLISPISIQFSQIYMDQIYDLFQYQNERKLIIRQDQITKQPYIENQIKINVSNLEEAFQVVNIGLENRKIAQQRINKRSSRGHGVLNLTFKSQSKSSETNLCKLCFVDLAGSQRVKQSESKGQTLNEAVRINSSLSALETLLMNIQQRTVRMYRANKLTRLLQPFIEAGKIRLIVTSNYDSIQPIQFAKRCKGIKFMEKDMTRKSIQKEKSLSPLRQKQQKQQLQQKIKQKNLLQCIFGSVNFLCQTYTTIQQLLANQMVHSNFTLDMTNIANILQIEKRVNQKINGLQEYEENILNCSVLQEDKNFSNISNVTQRSTNKSELQQKEEYSQEIFVSLMNPANQQEVQSEKGVHQFSTNIQNTPRKSFNNQHTALPTSQQQIMSLLNPFKPQAFLKAIHNIGNSIISLIRNMSQLIEYKNIYKKQLFTSEVKNELLEAKNQQYETIINYLVKTACSAPNNQNKHLHTQQNTISKHLKQMGVDVNSILKGSSILKHKNQKNQVQIKKFHTPSKRVQSKDSLNQPNEIQKKVRESIPLKQQLHQKLKRSQKWNSKSQEKLQRKCQNQVARKDQNPPSQIQKQQIADKKRSYHTENELFNQSQQQLKAQKKISEKFSTRIQQNFLNKQNNNNNFGLNYNAGYGQLGYKSHNLKGKNIGNVGRYDQTNSLNITNKGNFTKNKRHLNNSSLKTKQKQEQQSIYKYNQNSPLNRARQDNKGYIFIQQK